MGETTGQTIGMIGGGIIGGVIGGFPGAMIGMSLGGQLGLWIDPPAAPTPPPMGDLGANSYVRSTPVPLAFGQVKVFGGVVWIGELESGQNNQGSRKNPEYVAEMDVDYAVCHCEGPVDSYTGVYWVDEKRVGDLEDGWSIAFVSYLGTAAQTNDPIIASYQSNKSIPALPLKYSAYTVIDLHVEEQVLSKLPSISAEIKAFNIESGEEEANPIRCCYNFLTNAIWGVGLDTDLFNGDPDTADSPWKVAADYCDENVQITDWDDSLISEPRFRFSQVYDARSMAFDIITDMMITCRGLIRLKQGLIEPIIENANEVPEVYFSDRVKAEFQAGGSSTVNRLYADFSAYPNIYWFGDGGKITISGNDYAFSVKDQTDTYIDLFEDLPVSPNTSDDFEIAKDNIKEGSFNFKRTGDLDVSNRYRVEYIQRAVKDEDDNFKNEYIWDAVEKDSEDFYSKIPTNTKLKTIRLGGIKRKSQAMRMVQFYSDFGLYNRNYCDFITDVQGYYHAVGDIIGVSHSQTGWNNKWFRIIGMEEAENDEIKLQCFEYNPNVYNDVISKVTHTDDNVLPTPYAAPDIVERFYVVQDIDIRKIYILFKRPDSNPYFVGVDIFVSVNGGDWKFEKHIGYVTPSVKLDAGIDNSQTTIGYDNTTLYGSFPSSGSFWIEDELITYTGISGDPDYEFTGCGRGISPVAHTIDKYCMLKDDYTDSVYYGEPEVGQSWEIKAVSVTAFNLKSDFSSSPSKVITLS